VPCNRWRNSSLGEIPSSDDGVVERHCCATEGGGRMVWRVLSMMEVLVALVPSIVIAVGVGVKIVMHGGWWVERLIGCMVGLLPNLAVRFQKCHLAIFSSFHLGTHTNQYRRTAFFFVLEDKYGQRLSSIPWWHRRWPILMPLVVQYQNRLRWCPLWDIGNTRCDWLGKIRVNVLPACVAVRA
jgi:hypothetical protein